MCIVHHRIRSPEHILYTDIQLQVIKMFKNAVQHSYVLYRSNWPISESTFKSDGSTENTWNNIRQVKCTARDFRRCPFTVIRN